MIRPVLIAALGLTACAIAPAPKSLAELHTLEGWRDAKGADMSRAFARGINAAAHGKSRGDMLGLLQAEGYECTYGEASAAYPEPAAVCQKSFATRACQMDWEVTLTNDPKRAGVIDDLGTDFIRDCVGTKGDWPAAKKSAIDDQLAPSLPPQPAQ
jgi:hypothetical protein